MSDSNTPELLPVTADEDRCDICCRPREQHVGRDLQCDTTTYFRPMPPQSHSLPGDVGEDEQPGDCLRDEMLNIAAICEAKDLHVEAASLRSTARIVSEQLRKAQQFSPIPATQEDAVTIPVDHPLAQSLRTSQKTLDEIERQEQANIAGYMALRDFPVGSAATQEDAERSGDGDLRAHFTRMMEAAANYLEPTTYIAQHPQHDLNGPCRFTTEFPMPDENHSDIAKADINRRRDQAFIRDMIYMLDGPEQRAALSTPSPCPGDGMREALQLARDRLADMLMGDDGQAWKEAEKALPIIDAALTPSAVSGDAGEGDDHG